MGQLADTAVRLCDGAETCIGLRVLPGCFRQLPAHQVRLGAPRQVFLKISEDAQTACIYVTPVKKWDVAGYGPQHFRQDFDDSSRREAASIDDQAAVVDFANLPIETRVVFDRQYRRRSFDDREQRDQLRMNGCERSSST